VVFDLNSTAAPGASARPRAPVPVPADPALKPGTAVVAAPPSSAVALAGWYVQAGSFSSQENARRALADLHRRELPVSIQLTLVGKETWYRVRIGPYPDESVARRVLEGLPGNTYQGARVLQIVPES
jgi:cell division protein FtsN